MALQLPANFASDIKSRDTNLVPFVIIGETTPYIIISTSSFSFASPYTTLPLLLNIPSLKESLDVEKRNYKISNMTLNISNLPYEGKRFSERVSESTIINNSMINEVCRIFWASPSTDNFDFFPRVLSCSLILNDDYEGGDFAFFGGEYIVPKKAGSAVVFPSNFCFPHAVLPVTEGDRHAIITWIH